MEEHLECAHCHRTVRNVVDEFDGREYFVHYPGGLRSCYKGSSYTTMAFFDFDQELDDLTQLELELQHTVIDG